MLNVYRETCLPWAHGSLWSLMIVLLWDVLFQGWREGGKKTKSPSVSQCIAFCPFFFDTFISTHKAKQRAMTLMFKSFSTCFPKKSLQTCLVPYVGLFHFHSWFGLECDAVGEGEGKVTKWFFHHQVQAESWKVLFEWLLCVKSAHWECGKLQNNLSTFEIELR